MISRFALRCACGGLVAMASFAGAASGAVIVPGTYQLHNHPDGSARPPRYGMRLDELFNETSGHDVFTFDFDAPGSNMRLDYTGSTIRIYGVSAGGRDIGSGYAADQYNGFYQIDFLYTLGVTPNFGGDDDLAVIAPDMRNFGTIIVPGSAGGAAIGLADKQVGGLNFRFGDEDNDAGHRGFAGISGWGWLIHHWPGAAHVEASDWLFTGELIPTPGVGVLVGLGALAATRRRR